MGLWHLVLAWVGPVQGCILHGLAGVAVARLEIALDEGSKVEAVHSELNILRRDWDTCNISPAIPAVKSIDCTVHISTVQDRTGPHSTRPLALYPLLVSHLRQRHNSIPNRGSVKAPPHTIEKRSETYGKWIIAAVQGAEIFEISALARAGVISAEIQTSFSPTCCLHCPLMF